MASSNLIYDESWMVTLSNNVPITSSNLGVFTGNGKIGMHVSMTDVSAQKTLISAANLQYDQIGKYKSNTLEGFSVNNLKLLSLNPEAVSYEFQHQSLNMQNSEVSTRYLINNGDISVTSKVLPLRQFPYCILHTLEISPTNNMDTLDVFHEIKAPEMTSGFSYNNNTLFNERLYAEKGLYVLNAEANLETRGCKLVAASCYFFDTGNDGASVTELGFNISGDLKYAFQKWRLKNIVAQSVYKIYILSAVMSSLDFKEPLEESKRILMNVAFKEPDTQGLITKLYAENELQWDDMWNADVEIIPKSIISNQERDVVMKAKRHVRMSLFNIFSCLRSAVNTEVNPLNLSYIDANGNVFFDGDLWLIPVLIFIRPQIARIMIEFKYMLLTQAMQLAASFGYRGAKFPYKNDVMGYQNVYWDVVSPLHVFNNANICINVWNFYRVSLDIDWLQNKGYPMMRNIADFLAYFVKLENNTVVVPNTLGLGETQSDDHAFTINLIMLALRYAIEASNVLSVIPNLRWSQVLLKMKVPAIESGPNVDVIKYFKEYDGTTQVDILDNLAILMPYYSHTYFTASILRNRSAIARNLDYYSTRVKPSFEASSLNKLIKAALYGSLGQTLTSEMPNFYDIFMDIISNNTSGYWGFMNVQNVENAGIDISLNAFVILIVITCLCGLNIRGSTAPSNVVVETYRVEESLGTYMPDTWNNIRIGSVGINETFINVINKLSYGNSS
jgi:trehalose/maltose hydrolase-like predicted phosphorylase